MKTTFSLAKFLFLGVLLLLGTIFVLSRPPKILAAVIDGGGGGGGCGECQALGTDWGCGGYCCNAYCGGGDVPCFDCWPVCVNGDPTPDGGFICYEMGQECGWTTCYQPPYCCGTYCCGGQVPVGSSCHGTSGGSCGGGTGVCQNGSCVAPPAPTAPPATPTPAPNYVVCSNPSLCSSGQDVCCNGSCSSGTSCWCASAGACSSSSPSEGFCNSAADCGAGTPPCPIGLQGAYYCNNHACQSFCTPGGGTPAATPTPSGCDPTVWGPYGPCSGSPATKSRANACGTVQTVNCTGTIQAKAVVVSASDTSCAAVNASTTGLSGTVHQFTAGSASQPPAQTQTGATPVTFSNIVGGSYTEAPQTPANYNLVNACWSKAANTPPSGTGLTTSLSVPVDADTLTWNIGYTAGSPWVQTQGGNVYGSGNLTSYVPVGIIPRVFNTNGAGGYPGVVTYGTAYDFDSSPTSQGPTLVSSTNWLTNQTHSALDYYQLFYNRLGAPTVQNYDPVAQGGAQPATSGTYYVNGNLTTSGNWSVGTGQAIIFLINGNLTIGGKVNITGTGFIAFIVNGNITVASSVGGLYSSSLPVVEGVYITSPTGTFATGTSSVVGAERLVGKGMFIAGNFNLQRDLDALGQNPTTAAELFTYNPQLLVTMPDSLKDLPITWQEVAP